MSTQTIENYIKTIYQICSDNQSELAATGAIAAAMHVSPGTVTSMLKTLSQSGMVTYTPYEGVRLTESGRALALRIVRRHRLIELFLVHTVRLTWDEVHDEAENMEHAVSDLLVDRIDAYLNYPLVDPHGDPIPRADGTLPDATSHRLASCDTGVKFRLVRVLDQEPQFLRYLSEIGLPLGAEGRVTANRLEAGVVTVAINEQETSLGRETAEKLLVAPLPTE
ncbi:MAG: metal-dependent transcriptional regulator [Pirellulaceae bacterium]|nr:metal-dependent transcriptional regulator [Pirellulaceae bacterium]